MVWLATRTKDAIEAAVAADGGNRYRANLGMVIPHIGDAYRSDEDSYRTHLGASVIGGDCARAVAYGFRWAYKRPPRGKKGEPEVQAASRMIRLWNRGHMEEARFIALLLTAGIQVYQQDANGKQFRMSNVGGHFSGSGDGFVLGVPDLPAGVPCLGEFKTHSADSFEKLVDLGVRLSKPSHYTQMQTYMGHFGVVYALYVAVNKNNDELYCEIVQYDGQTCDKSVKLARYIVLGNQLPDRIRSASPGFFQCKYLCDFPMVCFGTKPVDRNCRTCDHVRFREDGTVRCGLREIFPADGGVLSKQEQIAGCISYRVGSMFKC